MSKTNIKNTEFTPIFDTVLDECGITIAAVFGRVWRYCQMERGFCHAEQETIAYQLGLSRQKVNIAIGELVRLGYLSDTTPNRKGRTRIYFDTGKAGGKVYEGVTLPVTEPVTEPVTKSDTKTVKKEKKEKTPTTQNSVEVAEFNSLTEEQRAAYQLARQVTSHEIALSKAMSETPMESAISLLEWHVDRETPNSRVAEALLNKIRAAESRERSIKEFKGNRTDVQIAFRREMGNWYGEISDDEIDTMWKEYVTESVPIYVGDQFDMVANGRHTTGTDDKTHYERMEEFIGRKAQAEGRRRIQQGFYV